MDQSAQERIREGDCPLPSTLSIWHPVLFAVRDMLLTLEIHLIWFNTAVLLLSLGGRWCGVSGIAQRNDFEGHTSWWTEYWKKDLNNLFMFLPRNKCWASLFKLFLLIEGWQRLPPTENTLESKSNHVFMPHTNSIRSVFIYVRGEGFFSKAISLSEKILC